MGASQGDNNKLNTPPRDRWLKDKWNKTFGAGKGDRQRPVDKQKFDEGFERIFGKREVKTWQPEVDPRKENRE